MNKARRKSGTKSFSGFAPGNASFCEPFVHLFELVI